jgi:hypothetical protein
VAGCIENVLINRQGVLPFYVENSLVYEARHKIIHYALEQDADLLFLDSDICFPLEGFDRLVQHNTDIVSGLYYGRNPEALPIAYKKVRPRTWYRKVATLERVDQISDLMEVDAVGLGFCLIKKNVLQAVYDGKRNPFEPFGNMGEDFCFFHRVRKKGFKVLLDTTFELKHLGEYAYTFRDSAVRASERV